MTQNDDNLHEEPNFSFQKEETSAFGMPSDYFASFEEKLRSRMEAEEELSEFPLLASVRKGRVFEVPADYFSHAENVLEYKTELTDHPLLSSFEKPQQPAVEEAYRERFINTLNYRIGLLEELKPYPLLYNMDKAHGFVVEESYFETVADRMKERIHAAPAERSPVLETLWSWLFGGRMAWAFGLALIIGLAFYFDQKHEADPVSSDCKTLACLERDEILSNKVIMNFDEEQLMDLVDVNALGKQLNLEDPKQDSLPGKKQRLHDIDTDELLDAL